MDAGHADLNPRRSMRRWAIFRVVGVIGVIGVMVVLAVCGVGPWPNMLDDDKGGPTQSDNASPKPSLIPVDISSRQVDPRPLTIAEVFPNDTIVIDASVPDEAYHITARQEQADCRTYTTGEISTLIQGLGCTQVVSAMMRSPHDYLVTGGIFNLDTVASAENAWASIRAMVDAKQGDLVGYAQTTDKTARQQVLAATVTGWSIKGHYLAFCVIARADGNQIPDRDPFASQIMYDIVEMYLKGVIVQARATNPGPDAGASDAPTPKPSG